MDSSKDSAAERIFGERLIEKIPAPIPETSVPPTHLSVDTESAIRNSASNSTLARTDSQAVDGSAYSQGSALRTLPGKLSCKACIYNHSLTMYLNSLDSVGRGGRGGRT